ncbi:hypothetical protein ACGC1H_002070 [Rhizoctonia solani]|uniref:F-box domain-containing protein n=1 Tax=Rhizoctonia solani TaxID=456999 RepID=A0A8H3A4U0_9AGAM|nr:unnamed protein product [Rhizoctonia solani]
MLTVPNPSMHLAIEQWEEAGVSLHKALARYLELSNSLDYLPVDNEIRSMNLTPRIDSALGSLQTTVNKQIPQIRSTLSQMRNKLCSSFHRLPEDVLSDIFVHVVALYIDPYRHRDPRSMKYCCIDIYCGLSKLVGVCTMWRRVALNRGTLWTVVPFFRSPIASFDWQRIMELAIPRAGGADLNLVADGFWSPDDIFHLGTYIARFRTVNIFTEYFGATGDILEVLASQHQTESVALSRLSISIPYSHSRRLPMITDYVFQSNSEQLQFQKIFERLSLLQLKGSLLRWDVLSFSDRLITLCLKEISLGYDSEIALMLKALTSATQLRELTLIRITTFNDPLPHRDLSESSKISLPSLRSLLIQDVYFNTLRFLLLAVQSGSHLLSIVFTRKTLHNNYYEGSSSENTDITRMCELLRSTPVHALLIDGETWDNESQVVTTWQLGRLLEALPALNTFWANMWYFDDLYCKSLQRPRECEGSSFPPLVNLYITCVEFPDPNAFKRVVDSYSSSIQRVALGGPSSLITKAQVDWDPPGSEEELVAWLRENVPEFIRTGRSFEPPEFRQISWQLW